MLSSTGTSRFYYGSISAFNPNDWTSGSYVEDPEGYLITYPNGVMFGPWIVREVPVNSIKKINSDRVFLVENGLHVKMVLESTGEGRYYEGKLDDFNPDLWDTYSIVPACSYQIKNTNGVMYGHNIAGEFPVENVYEINCFSEKSDANLLIGTHLHYMPKLK